MTRVSIDPKFLNHHAGIGNDTRVVLEAFANLGFSLEPISTSRRLSWTGHIRKVRDYATAKGFTPLKLKVPSSNGLSYFPQISGSLPISKEKAIWRIHDIFPVTHPELFTSIGTQLFRQTLKNINFEDNYFLCNSKFTRDVFISEFPQFSKSSEIVFCQTRVLTTRRCNSCLGCSFSEKTKSYVLSVNTIEPRKNLDYLFKVWEDNYNRRIKLNLVVVGQIGWNISERTKDKLYSTDFGVIYLERICDGSLNEIYKNSAAYISSSIAEGFNLSAEQARILKLPLFLSDIPIHRELYGQYGAQFFSFNEASLLVDLLSNFKSEGYEPIFATLDTPRDSITTSLEVALKKWGLV